MCVTTNNADFFLMPSRLKSHIILVLDRLQGVARVNCLVIYNVQLVELPRCTLSHVICMWEI